MRINFNDIENLTNVKQASAYQKAMNVKDNIESVGNQLYGIDFNSKNEGEGEVLLTDRRVNLKQPRNCATSVDGNLSFDSETEEIKNLDINIPGRWGCIYTKFKKETSPDKEVYIQKEIGGITKKVIIDKQTGAIDYRQYMLGIPVPSSWDI
jgi:hypothetical protein